MKILLINPSQGAVYGKLNPPAYQPMGLGYLAAVLEADGHSVQVLDANADHLDAVAIGSIVKVEKPELIGITATTPVYKNALALADILKKNSTAITVLGGNHATLMPRESALHSNIDFVVIGEGERTIVELAHCLETGGDISRVNGLIYKEGNGLKKNEKRAVIEDLDSIPFPARHLFRSHRYAYPDALKYPAFPIISSRGCPGACTFCTAKNLQGSRFRYRSVGNVLDEIDMLIREYGAKEIHIWDDNFITNHERVFAFRDGIVKRNIKIALAFPNGLRADFINREIMMALREAGTYSLAIGVESGSQAILDSIRKGVTLAQIEDAFRFAKEAGMETWGFFLLGLPGEDARTLNETLKFAIRLDPCIAKFHILKPYPRSVAYNQLKKQGLIVDDDYGNYGFHTDPVHRLSSLTQEELIAWQKRCYRRFYLRPEKMIRSITRIKTLYRLQHNLITAWSLLKNKIL
jgi:anaerobic magnesium-protoporphyrin IX monomethyl ester cyclase